MDYEIVHLPKERWKGTVVQFPDRLYEESLQNAYAWGILKDDHPIAVLETDHELSSNQIRIAVLWVAEPYQNQGIGHSLIQIAKEQARRERSRTVILETQSCNVNAIDFYCKEGFKLIGMDSSCYNNNDRENKEARLEYCWFPEKKRKLDREAVQIRMETKDDWYQVELMTQHAFWNKHRPGCDEHYLVHRLRRDQDYIPELSRIALLNGNVIGCIMYSKARVSDGTDEHEVITFGPLCVEPKWQGCGVGEILLRETIQLAKEKGYKCIIIFGEPDYYPRLGFLTCDHFGITTSEGKNFDAFMGMELIEGSMTDIKGKFYESAVFEDIIKENVEEFNQNFKGLAKLEFPGQWQV